MSFQFIIYLILISGNIFTWHRSNIQEHQDLQQSHHRDVTFAASGRIFYCIRMYLLLHQNVISLPFSPVKFPKNDRKSLVLNRKNNFFALYLLGFRPKIPQKHRYFADFMPKVVIGGNKATIKTPLIATRYPLIIKELSISVANVTLN